MHGLVRAPRVSGGDDLFVDDVSDGELHRPAGEVEWIGEQEDDRGRSPAHEVTSVRVQTVLVLGDESNDHLFSDSLYRQMVAKISRAKGSYLSVTCHNPGL